MDERSAVIGFWGTLTYLHYTVKRKQNVSEMIIQEQGCRKWRICRMVIGFWEGAFLELRTVLAAFGKMRGRTFCFFVRQPLQAPLIRDGISPTQGKILVYRVPGY